MPRSILGGASGAFAYLLNFPLPTSPTDCGQPRARAALRLNPSAANAGGPPGHDGSGLRQPSGQGGGGDGGGAAYASGGAAFSPVYAEGVEMAGSRGGAWGGGAEAPTAAPPWGAAAAPGVRKGGGGVAGGKGGPRDVEAPLTHPTHRSS